MKAYISVQHFGDASQVQGLCDTINHLTMFHSYVDDKGNAILSCKVAELGGLLAQLASFRETNWVEYTVQFDC
jgi:hypothetical protein